MDEIKVDLEWQGDMLYRATSGKATWQLDGDSDKLASPMQSLAGSVAACMAIDVVMILEKGRQTIESFEVSATGKRASQSPRRFTELSLHFTLGGNIEASRVERAIELSREKYCSVFQSLREDMVLNTSYELS